jgi:hypothetical protein
MSDEYLSYKVVRTNGHDEIVVRANNLIVGTPPMEVRRRVGAASTLANCCQTLYIDSSAIASEI